ncbi:uncharacterized protein LOC111698089 [Eurytemora carolleeae]|uniref:uncharacterized protein LOC111698089 n=1 Tax=Eurytemora carolleeae TaxID=1294199 RepID=UPI000C776574|nr:uncharacterized protein LOC111698089 [Eurytemora carolleeae]|eukprot:XP_023324094.1 uncharacterized protein LOC111698089 [Eurytemora affinis]
MIISTVPLIFTAIITTWVEGLLSIGFNITYLLCNSCLIKVSDSDEKSSTVNKVARLFYSTYVTSGECKFSDGTPAVVENTNDLTKPGTIFIFQILFLIFHTVWVLSTSGLRKVTKTHRHFAYPWIGLTLTIIIMDLVSTGFIFSDTGKWTESAETETMENGVYAFVAMLLYTSRGFIVLFYNMVLLILILNSIFTQESSESIDSPDNDFWTNKGFEDIQREMSMKSKTEPNSTGNLNKRATEPVLEHRIQPIGSDLFTVENYTPEKDEPEDGLEFDERSSRPDVFFRNPTYADPNPEHEQYYHEPEDVRPIYQKPHSFKEKIREAREREENVAPGGMFRYSIGDRPQSQTRSQAVPSPQDIETTFDFLSKYDDQKMGNQDYPNSAYSSEYPDTRQPYSSNRPDTRPRSTYSEHSNPSNHPEERRPVRTGQGWGKINSAPRGEKYNSTPRSDKFNPTPRSNRFDHPGRPDRFDHPGRPDRFDHPKDRFEERERSDRFDHPGRPDRSDHPKDRFEEQERSDKTFVIPRAKVSANLSRSSSLLRAGENKPQLRDYETRYYVPLKH